MIVWVASYPRSGNRLCRTTLRKAFGVRTASAASVNALYNDLGELLGGLGIGPDDDPLPALREHEETFFLKTHSMPDHLHWLPDESEGILQRADREVPPGDKEPSPALYLVRDGRDCLVSFAHYLKEIADRPWFVSKSNERAIARLMRQRRPFGGWSGNVGAWRRRPSPVQFVRFEDLLEDPIAAIAAGAKELGVPLPEPQNDAPSFEEMKARSPKPELLRRGRKEAWRTEFPVDLLDEFWERHGEEMEALGYPHH